jgi:hypothetical protein
MGVAGHPHFGQGGGGPVRVVRPPPGQKKKKNGKIGFALRDGSDLGVVEPPLRAKPSKFCFFRFGWFGHFRFASHPLFKKNNNNNQFFIF